MSNGRLLGGRYRLTAPIGKGATATVWRARDELIGRETAVKEVVFPHGLEDHDRERVCARAQREAGAISRLSHPAIVTIHDVITEDDRPWIVMELIDGDTLERRLKRDGPLSPESAAEVGVQLSEALRAAHRAGIVHRDVKPSNVMIGAGYRIVLTDFGIATFEGAAALTQSGTFLGSPGYVAPEVAGGERATVEADLWSLGATLYCAVEGRPPYSGDSAMAILAALMTRDPDPPRRAGPLRPVLNALLRKDPAARARLATVSRLLEQVVNPPPRRHARRRPPRWRAGGRRGRTGRTP